jgi:hypothetical protein
LHRNPYAVVDLAHTALNHVLNAQFACHLPHVDCFAFILEGGIARDDEQMAEARQLRQDVFGEPIGEEFLLRFAAHIGERQHHDRRSVGVCGCA